MKAAMPPRYSDPDANRRLNPRIERPTRHSHSAGGVAYRHRVDESQGEIIEIALIATNRGQRWQLPKGRLEPGESAVQAAIREVEEETGLLTTCDRFLTTIEYHYIDTYSKHPPELVIKQVDFYLLRVVGGELSDDSFEVDSVAWRTPAEALTQLTFESEQQCIKLALEYWT